METIGVGLIGTGFMGKCHALAWTNVQPVFGDTPVVRRLALCEVDEGLARQRAKEFGFETATADWRALVADPGVDVAGKALVDLAEREAAHDRGVAEHRLNVRPGKGMAFAHETRADQSDPDGVREARSPVVAG